MEKLKNKKIIIPIILLVLVIALGLTYAWFVWTDNGGESIRIAGGSLDLILDETSAHGINLEKMIPMSIEQGLNTNSYTFKIKNNSKVPIDYTLNLEDLELETGEEQLSDSDIRYVLLNKDSYTNYKYMYFKNGAVKLYYDRANNEVVKITNADGTANPDLLAQINSYMSANNVDVTDEYAVYQAFKYIMSPTGSYTNWIIKTHLLDGSNENVSINIKEAGFTITYDPELDFYTSVNNANGQDIYANRMSLNMQYLNTVSNKSKEAAVNLITSSFSGLTTTVTTNEAGRKLEVGTLAAGEERSYELKMWINSEADTSAMNKVYRGRIKVNGTQSTKTSSILNVYRYNEDSTADDFCLGGEESTCVAIDKPATYPVGTIVKYKVNDSDTGTFFNVISDNGSTLTLQQRENTVNQVAWDSSNRANNGPVTALPALELATKDWDNVVSQSYMMGSTEFGSNEFKSNYTGAATEYEGGYKYVTSNFYILDQRSAKARMITVQELSTLGCKERSSNGCPIFLENYSSSAASFNGTKVNNNFGYWTMTARIYNDNTDAMAWTLDPNYGGLENHMTNNTSYGARAVVVINK